MPLAKPFKITNVFDIFEFYQKQICDLLDIDLISILSANRKFNVNLGRQMLVYLMYHEGIKIKEICKILNKHRTTIMHSINQIEFGIGFDKHYSLINKINKYNKPHYICTQCGQPIRNTTDLSIGSN